MKKLFAFVLGLLLFLCPFAVQAEEIADAPAPKPIAYNNDCVDNTIAAELANAPTA